MTESDDIAAVDILAFIAWRLLVSIETALRVFIFAAAEASGNAKVFSKAHPCVVLGVIVRNP